jgi:hypothetical protein
MLAHVVSSAASAQDEGTSVEIIPVDVSPPSTPSPVGAPLAEPSAVETASTTESHAADSRPTVPEHRIEVVGPSFGPAFFHVPSSNYSRAIFMGIVDVRYAHQSGHGVSARGAWGTNVWGEGFGAEVDYPHRLILAGHTDLSLGVDLSVGATVAGLAHNEQTIAAGLHLGGNAGASLDFRTYNFTLSLAVRYRLLVPTELRLDGQPAGPAQIFSATLGAGFSFY